MNVGLSLIQEVVHDLSVGEVLECCIIFVSIFHQIDDVSDFLKLSVQVWNDTSVQNVVNIFNKSLKSDLSIREVENCRFHINTCTHIKLFLHIISPFLEPVILGNFYLEVVKDSNEGSKLGQRFTS